MAALFHRSRRARSERFAFPPIWICRHRLDLAESGTVRPPVRTTARPPDRPFRPTARLTVPPPGRPTAWLSDQDPDQPTDRLTARPTARTADRATERPSARLQTDRPTALSTDVCVCVCPTFRRRSVLRARLVTAPAREVIGRRRDVQAERDGGVKDRTRHTADGVAACDACWGQHLTNCVWLGSDQADGIQDATDWVVEGGRRDANVFLATPILTTPRRHDTSMPLMMPFLTVHSGALGHPESAPSPVRGTACSSRNADDGTDCDENTCSLRRAMRRSGFELSQSA